jgi:class 3 adenylate cyclase/predicted ATPase
MASKALPPTAPGPAPGDSAQRRQLTVMVADLVDSTALATRLDPEDLRVLIGAFHQAVAATVARFEGFVAKYMGDGVLIYFGYPRAREDDVERAVRAGLALIAAIGELDAKERLAIRIGAATGLVVVGDLVGSGEARERPVFGETPNLAARLQAAAAPGTMVIGSTTRQLLGRLFEYRDLDRIEVKGFAAPVEAYQVLRESAVESRFEATRTATAPLVGRDAEVAELVGGWREAKAGRGRGFLISGEPGIGKSRLVAAMLERLAAEPHTRLRYFCSPHHRDSALHPVIAQLERAAAFRREDTPAQRLDKLEAVLAAATSPVDEGAALIADLMSIPAGERYPQPSIGPQKRKERTLEALKVQFVGLAAKQPVLMVFEDVHWSDPTTRELLDLLVASLPALRILALITCRPEFTSPWPDLAHIVPMRLHHLQPRQCAEMIAHVTGGRTLPREIAEQIIDRTDGVPLFIEELTKSVIESGSLTPAGDDGYAVAGPAAALAIPSTLHASLLARIDRLAPTREVAQIGAALGRSFSYELVSAVAAMPARQLAEALAQLVNAELIFQRGTPPDAEYTFKHALVQDTAYGTLLRSRRQELHARIAAIIEVRFPDTVRAHPEVLARHCTEAGIADKAAAYWLAAGRRALARSAMPEAVAQLGKALGLLNGLPGTHAREQELEAELALGHALIAAKGYAAAELDTVYARARALCDRLGRRGQLDAIMYGQFAFRQVRAELTPAGEIADEICRGAIARGDTRWQCVGARLKGANSFHAGRFLAAREEFELALALWDPAFRALAAEPNDTYVISLAYLSQTLLHLGCVGEARARREQALGEARRLPPYALAFVHCMTWPGDWALGTPADTVLAAAEEVVAISGEHSFPLWLGLGTVMRGWCLGAAGHSDEGIPVMLHGLSIFRATGANLMLRFVLMTLAESYGMAGQAAQGLERLAEAEGLVETQEDRWCEAELNRLRGRLSHARRDHAAAEASYRRALAIAQRQEAKLWELKAASSLAGLLSETGRRAEAYDLLAPIENGFAPGSVLLSADPGLLPGSRRSCSDQASAPVSRLTTIEARPGPP